MPMPCSYLTFEHSRFQSVMELKEVTQQFVQLNFLQRCILPLTFDTIGTSSELNNVKNRHPQALGKQFAEFMK